MTALMTVPTAVVVALSLRASQQGHGQPASVAPAGVVATTPRSAPTHRSTTPSAAPTKTSKSPKAPRSHAARPSAPSSPSAKARSITVNGAVADTMYGPVQVQITMRGSRIVGAQAIDYPQGGARDQEINSQAIPLLDQETLQIQSAQIDTVSGATYTSDGYRRSLQSALDAAHRATS